MAWRGKAVVVSRGKARHGAARLGLAVEARRGTARQGRAWHGAAVMARRVMLRLSGVWQGSQGKARSCKAGSGALRFGLAVMARSVEHCRVQ